MTPYIIIGKYMPPPPPPPPHSYLLHCIVSLYLLFCLLFIVVDFSTIDDIMGYLHDYADKWEAIGIGLNFQPDELNNIKRIVTLTTPQQRLRELLYQWIQRDTTTSQVPTMGSLHHTLSSDQVGLGNVAFNIKNDMAFNMENNSQVIIVQRSSYMTAQHYVL